MIYVDTSIILAELLSEDSRPGRTFWQQRLVTSRLTQYETYVRLHAHGVTRLDDAAELLGGCEILELSPLVLTRALEPFKKPARTLDALHLASASYLNSLGNPIQFATYDRRLREAAEALPLAILGMG